jgi:transposase
VTGPNLAKTDALDAAMLTRMGAVLSLEVGPVPSSLINDLRDLCAACNALIKDQVAAQTRVKAITLPLLKRQNAARLKQIEVQRDAIDAEINTLIHGDPGHRGGQVIFLSFLQYVSAIGKTSKQVLHQLSREK